MSLPAGVTQSRFEIVRDGQTAILIYQRDNDGWLSLLHTEVPEAIRGQGIANELAQMAFEFAKAHALKVDVVCPVVFHFLSKHPEYKPLVQIRGYGKHAVRDTANT